jgi:sodium transport system permease protein
MLSFFRDKKALITLFLPILIYPVFMIFLIGVMNLVSSSNEQQVIDIYVDEQVEAAFFVKLSESEQLNVSRKILTEDALADLDFNVVGGYLHTRTDADYANTDVDNNTAYVFNYHSNFDYSTRAYDAVSDIYDEYLETQRTSELNSLGLLEAYDNMVVIDHEDIMGEGDSRFASMIMGMILPFIIVLYGIVGTNILSSDLSAGEKERATLETIFSAPIKRYEIITGKLFACTTVGLISGGINILSMFPLIILISSSFDEIHLNITFGTLLFLFFQLIPIMIMCSALFIGIGMFARTYQESQSYASVALIALMGLTYIFLIPDLEGSTLIYALPITNAMMLMKEAFLGSYPWPYILQVFIVNMGVAVLAVVFMNLVFKNDRMIFGGDSK